MRSAKQSHQHTQELFDVLMHVAASATLSIRARLQLLDALERGDIPGELELRAQRLDALEALGRVTAIERLEQLRKRYGVPGPPVVERLDTLAAEHTEEGATR